MGGSALNLYYLLKEIPPGIDPLGPDNVLALRGSVLTGVTITYPLPQNAFDPFICMNVLVKWLCDGCGPTQAIQVVPHPTSVGIIGIEWQTFITIPAVGMTSLVCPGTISAEEASWGRVKALYSN